MARTRIALNESEFFLAQGQDAVELRGRIEEAIQTGGGFVEFMVVGNRSVSVLITSVTRVVISVETVELDARDTGDEAVPYGGEYDLL
ncbi:hypothetical protein [Microbacterium oxydans]|uniref:hypothetical protein n=1 Tax=Microbacterium oxydans TaxID=82380 RepID=UPI0024AD27B0|nr:hypothetical protein [Microbacterium oxydans]